MEVLKLKFTIIKFLFGLLLNAYYNILADIKYNSIMKKPDIKIILEKYFKLFSSKDIYSLEQIFSKDIELIDWEINCIGIKKVLEANKKIFESVSSIKVTTKEIYVDGLTSTCIIEILINEKDMLKVVDIISFTDQGKISKISAYKQ